MPLGKAASALGSLYYHAGYTPAFPAPAAGSSSLSRTILLPSLMMPRLLAGLTEEGGMVPG